MKLSPKLRFPEFREEWKQKKFSEIYNFLRTNSLSRAELRDSGQVKNIHYGDIHTKLSLHFDSSKEAISYLNTIDNSDYCKLGDMVIADASEDRNDVGKSVEIVKIHGDKVVAGLHTLLARPDSGHIAIGFSGYLMQVSSTRRQIWRIATGASVLGVSKSELAKIVLTTPGIGEQQLIADFLTAVDEKIGAMQKKINLLKKYKKGVMQKIFSQQIRFEDENGKDYLNWASKNVGSLVKIISGYTFPSSTYTDIGKYRVVTIANVQSERMNLKNASMVATLPTNIQAKQILKIGDILISMTGNVGRVCKVDQENCLLNQRVGKLIPQQEVNKEFLFYSLAREAFLSKMVALAQGGAQDNLSNKDISSFLLDVPNREEQQKIADFLTALDDKIELEDKKLEQAKRFKKALLQQMFV